MVMSSSQSIKLPSIKTLGLAKVPKKIYDYNLSSLVLPPLATIGSSSGCHS